MGCIDAFRGAERQHLRRGVIAEHVGESLIDKQGPAVTVDQKALNRLPRDHWRDLACLFARDAQILDFPASVAGVGTFRIKDQIQRLGQGEHGHGKRDESKARLQIHDPHGEAGHVEQRPFTDGRRLVTYQRDNTADTYSLMVRGYNQDDMIRAMQEADRLLTKAMDYWTAEWQQEPVYLVAKSPAETNARYAHIYAYQFPDVSDPYETPFYKRGTPLAVEDLAITIEQARESDKYRCMNCHDGDNSPHFDFDAYWPQVEHHDDLQ